MKTLFAAVILTSVAALTGPASAAEPTIPVIVKDTTSNHWQIVLAGARKAGKDLGVKVPELGAQSESDINGQITILENAVAEKPATIAIAPTQFAALGKPIDEAAKSVKIIGIDSGADSKAFTSFLTPDNVQGGRAAADAFHGFGIVQIGLPPFIMTLASLTALRGIGLLITNGQTISGMPAAFTDFSLDSYLGIPSLFWMVILVSLPAYVFLQHTRWGRYLYAIGSNAEAARLTGVNVKAMIYVAYIISAGLAAFVGVLLAARIGIGNATQGEGWELQAIASSVTGGTSLFGAVGSVQGPLLGSFILTTINNGANLLAINPFWQRIITGALIIVIVYFDHLRRKRR